MKAQEPYRVLFVCTGNICRSPAAEGVLNRMLAEAGLGGKVRAESAGTISYHTGERADPRMRAAASRRGYPLESRARQVRPEDFQSFDLILAMDRDHLRTLQQIRPGTEERARLKLFSDYCREHTEKDVPDPYYGGDEGFEHVLHLLEDGCRQLVAELQQWDRSKQVQ